MVQITDGSDRRKVGKQEDRKGMTETVKRPQKRVCTLSVSYKFKGFNELVSHQCWECVPKVYLYNQQDFFF